MSMTKLQKSSCLFRTPVTTRELWWRRRTCARCQGFIGCMSYDTTITRIELSEYYRTKYWSSRFPVIAIRIYVVVTEEGDSYLVASTSKASQRIWPWMHLGWQCFLESMTACALVVSAIPSISFYHGHSTPFVVVEVPFFVYEPSHQLASCQ